MDGSGVYRGRVSCKIGTRTHEPRFDGLTSANIMTFPSTDKHHTLPPRHYCNNTISEHFFSLQRWSRLYYNIVHRYNKYCPQLCIIMCVRVFVQASARAEKYENPSRAKYYKDRLRRDILINMSLCILNYVLFLWCVVGTLAVYKNIYIIMCDMNASFQKSKPL